MPATWKWIWPFPIEQRRTCPLCSWTGDCQALKKLLDIYQALWMTSITFTGRMLEWLQRTLRCNTPVSRDTSGCQAAHPLRERMWTFIENPQTATGCAVYSGNLELVEYLVQVGANPMAITRTAVTPFFVAAKRGHLEILEKLLVNQGWSGHPRRPGIHVYFTSPWRTPNPKSSKVAWHQIGRQSSVRWRRMRHLAAYLFLRSADFGLLLIQYGAIWNYPPGVNKHTPLYWAISKRIWKRPSTFGPRTRRVFRHSTKVIWKWLLRRSLLKWSICSCLTVLTLIHPGFYRVSLLKEPIASIIPPWFQRLLLAGSTPITGLFLAKHLRTAVVEPKSDSPRLLTCS